MTDARDNFPDRLYGASQVAELDRRVIEDCGVPGFTLMQRAAAAAFETLREHWPPARRVVAVCAPCPPRFSFFLFSRLAREAGCDVRLFFLGTREKARGDAGRALAEFEAGGGECEAFDGRLPDADVVVDALLGTGLGRPVEGRFRDAVAAIAAARERGAGVLAVDIPSGLDADRGSIWGTAVVADATPTFIGLKLGLVTGHGPGRPAVRTPPTKWVRGESGGMTHGRRWP
jgi:NAD(P)H-hydrate epimerase